MLWPCGYCAGIQIENSGCEPLLGCRGVARIFQRGGGGHTGSNNIVMAFSPRNVVGCLLKKRLTKGGGAQAPKDPPSYALGVSVMCSWAGPFTLTVPLSTLDWSINGYRQICWGGEGGLHVMD